MARRYYDLGEQCLISKAEYDHITKVEHDYSSVVVIGCSTDPNVWTETWCSWDILPNQPCVTFSYTDVDIENDLVYFIRQSCLVDSFIDLFTVTPMEILLPMWQFCDIINLPDERQIPEYIEKMIDKMYASLPN